MKIKIILILLLICGFVKAETPVVQWARSFGGTNDDIPQSIATDKAGNVYIAGSFAEKSITFDSIILTKPGDSKSLFLVKLNSKGNVLWAKRSDGVNDGCYVTSMVTDSFGNIYVSGNFSRNSITFGKFVLQNENAGSWGKMYLAKYDSLGNVLWAKTSINNGGESTINSICTDKYGNIFTTGYFRSDSLILDSKMLINNGGFYADMFFAKYDPAGNVLFVKSIGSDNVEAGCSITTSSKGNIFISGYYFSSNLTFGTITLTNKINNRIPSSDIFIAKFDESANVIWAKSMGSIGYDNCNSISVDLDENVYLGGYFGDKSNYLGSTLSESFIAFDNIKLQALNGEKNIFISKYNSSGNAVWAKTNPNGSYGEICSVLSDKMNVYAIGYTFGSAIFRNDTIKSNGSSDAFVAKFNSTGNVLFAKGYGGLGSDVGNCIATDKNENICIAGIITNYSINFDSISIKSISGEDIFVAKISASSTLKPKFITFCADDSILTIIAPSNNKFYTWIDVYDKVIGNSQTLTLTNPVDSAVYICNFKDASDSTFTIKYTLLRNNIILDFSSSISDCATNTVKFTNQSTTNRGSLTYLWDFGDGTTSTEMNPIHKYATMGIHQVSLSAKTSPANCANSISKSITDYPKPIIKIDGDSTICHGIPVTLKAQGAASYKWSTGSTAETIQVATTQKVWLMGYSASGCVSDTVFLKVTDRTPVVSISGNATYCMGLSVTLKARGASSYKWSTGTIADSIKVNSPSTIWVVGYTSTCVSDTVKYRVSEEPDFNVSINGNLYICSGESTNLIATGAASYRWSSGEKTTSIIISKPGDYSVIGSNARGCERELSFNVTEEKLPTLDFTVSSPTIDSRHNKLTCKTTSTPGIEYSWNMGDGSTEHGSETEHTYNIPNSVNTYTITLTATNTWGCTNSQSKDIDVILFIPNVFSPNGDGVNDVFMPDVNLEIQDRNGILLFKGTNGWDGNYHLKKMPDDTYYYVVTYKDKNGQTQMRKGYVILKR